MRAFYLAWTEQVSNLQRIVGEIPWGQNGELVPPAMNSQRVLA
ncbi:MAG: hypothetical protein HY748_11020 [Elusimicrobia bacterium]|nr:hypothetical protein [Elusimicrobiota bacterium]